MLTAQGPFITMKTGAAEWAVALVVGALLYGVLAATIVAPNAFGFTATYADRMNDPATSMSSIRLGEALLGVEKASPVGRMTGSELRPDRATRKQMGYLLPFEIVSVHLLVVLIGAAYLARAKRRRGADT